MAYTLYEGWLMLYRTHSDGSRQALRVALLAISSAMRRCPIHSTAMAPWPSRTPWSAVFGRPICTQ